MLWGLLTVAPTYTTPEFIDRFADVGSVALTISAIFALVYTISKAAVWLDRRRDDHFARRVKEVVEPIIDKATYPIQENSNGGYSLPDVARDVAKLNERFNAVEAKLGIKDRRDPVEAMHEADID